MAEAAGGAGAGAPAAGGSGAGGTDQGAGGGAPPQGAAGTQQPQGVAGAGGSGQPGAGSQFTYQEDRSKWVHPDTLRTRLSEVTGKHKSEVERLQRELEVREQRMRVLAGLDPQSQEDPGKAEVRQAILELFPQLGKLTDEALEKVLATAQHGDAIEQTTRAYWDRHADQMLGDLRSLAADKTGLELNDKQSARLEREYTHFIRASLLARQRATESGDTTYDFQNDALARHNRGDKKLLEEFVNEFVADFVEPVKRQAVSAAVRRQGRPVPSGGRQRQTPVQGPPQIDYTDDDAFKKALRDARASGA